MIYAIAAVAVAGVGYAVYKHYTLTQVVAAVKAEVAKIEGEIVSGALAAEVKAGYAVIVARIKAKL